MAAFLVTHFIEWREHFFGEFACIFQDSGHYVFTERVATFQCLVMGDVEQVVEDELDIAQGWMISRHATNLVNGCCGSSGHYTRAQTDTMGG
jgi:hypothetical protein